METPPWANIRQKRKDWWDENNLSLSLFVYKAVGSGRADEVTKFIHAFKSSSSDDECFKVAIVEVHDAVHEFIESWKQEYHCRYVLPVPSHVAHQVSDSSNRMCYFLASMYHLEYSEKLLFRARSITPAHMARSWQRLTVKEQFESLGCSKTNLAGAGVILFDDIRNTGNTSQACKRRLQDAKCGKVVRLFLGRTEG